MRLKLMIHFIFNTLAPVQNFLNSSFDVLFNYVSNNSVGEMIGGLVGGSALIVGATLLLKQAFTGDEGFKTVKQIGLLALLPIGSLAIGAVINFSQIQGKMTDFFVIIRNLLYQWNFFLNIPLVYDLLTASLSLLGAYWTFKLVLFFNDFFNQR